ncbi:primosomal protein N' [Nitrospira sp. KM1]|uniref:replication restart helicase PriA n=1 Tax=Nitrospira sp. KM1 TaxID=1936990 RepID=UPI0013A74E6B|nr:primosomal protein N' [Nitrospira sp. KM1]BCA55395.1 primosomal protein N' [Nitrospira sp. KM1]
MNVNLPSPISQTDSLYADVIVPRHMAGPFTYKVPSRLASSIKVGHLVVVPFGKSILHGAVIELARTFSGPVEHSRVREVQGFVGGSASAEIPSRLLHLAREISHNYCAPLGQCLRLVMPPTHAWPPDSGLLKLTESGRDALNGNGTLPPDERILLKRLLRKRGGIRQLTLTGKTGSSVMATIEGLLSKGWIERSRVLPAGEDREDGRIDRWTIGGDGGQETRAESFQWEQRISTLLLERRAARMAVQASSQDRIDALGRAVSIVLGQQRTVMVLVGEANRAERLAAMLSAVIKAKVNYFHSGLREEQRCGIWDEVNRQKVPIVVGTRSALFLPMTQLGLIWIEEDEDAAFKEPQEPRYHAREVAWMRANSDQALLVQASLHLSLESEALSQGDVYTHPSSVARLSSIEVVDLRAHPRNKALSPRMIAAIEETIHRQEGVVLFLNRKGYAGALVCGECGQVPRCASCSVALTYYRLAGRLSCSYCGVRIPIPETCAACGGSRLQPIGEGTERVEDEIKGRFPGARVVRADGETMRKPAHAKATWSRISRREWDVLIGTQLILRDSRLSGAGLVGIVQADSSLNRPDFRAAERTYHQLLDAIELVGRDGGGVGRVIIQSYLPHHHAIQSIARSDGALFKLEELSHRQALMYPPVVHLIALQVSGLHGATVVKAAREWASRLQEFPQPHEREEGLVPRVASKTAHSFMVLGPVPSPIATLRGRSRWQILIKTSDRDYGVQVVRLATAKLEEAYPARMAKFDVDVDPVETW